MHYSDFFMIDVSKFPTNIAHIYCFDLGAGNVYAMMTNPSAATDTATCGITANGHHEMSGYLEYTPSGQSTRCMAVGNNIEAKLTGIDDFTGLVTNIKGKPTKTNRRVLVKYARAWLEYLKNLTPEVKRDVESGSCMWIVGIPTGWSKGDMEAYRNIFIEAGYPWPVMISESNAAVQHMLRAEPELQKIIEAHGSVILIDLGAYSNDATILSKGQDDKNFVSMHGGYTGAGLIDMMIAMCNLYARDKYEEGIVNVRRRIRKEVLSEMKELFETDPDFRHFIFIQSRLLKESYFNAFQNGNSDAALRSCEYPKTGLQFRLIATPEMMEDILVNKSVREILGEQLFKQLSSETQEELGDNSWGAALRNFLDNAKKKYEGLLASSSQVGVIVTGGASKMQFVKGYVEQVFGTEPYMDADSIETICKGLESYAKISLQKQQFEAALARYRRSNLDDVLNEIMQDIWADVVLKMCKIIDDEIGPNCLKFWSRMQPDETIPYLVRRLKSWSRSENILNVSFPLDAGKHLVTDKYVKKFLECLKKKISKKLNKLLHQYDKDLSIDSSEIRSHLDLQRDWFDELCKSAFYQTVDFLIEQINSGKLSALSDLDNSNFRRYKRINKWNTMMTDLREQLGHLCEVCSNFIHQNFSSDEQHKQVFDNCSSVLESVIDQITKSELQTLFFEVEPEK